MVRKATKPHDPANTFGTGPGVWYKPIKGYDGQSKRYPYKGATAAGKNPDGLDEWDRTVFDDGYDDAEGTFASIKKGDIGFYTHGQPPNATLWDKEPFAVFANTCAGFGRPFYVRDPYDPTQFITFTSREQAFQSTKFTLGSNGFWAAMQKDKGKDAATAFRNLKGHYSADIPASPTEKEYKGDPFFYGDLILFSSILCNVTQDPRLLDRLLNCTYRPDGTPADIFENAPGDAGWGVGADGTGENKLGRMYMKARELLLNELKETGCIAVRDTIDSDLLLRNYGARDKFKHLRGTGGIENFSLQDLDRLTPRHQYTTYLRQGQEFTHTKKHAVRTQSGSYVFQDCNEKLKQPVVTVDETGLQPNVFRAHNPHYAQGPEGKGFGTRVSHAIFERFNLGRGTGKHEGIPVEAAGDNLQLVFRNSNFNRNNIIALQQYLFTSRVITDLPTPPPYQGEFRLDIPKTGVQKFLEHVLKFDKAFVGKFYDQFFEGTQAPSKPDKDVKGSEEYVFTGYNPNYRPNVVKDFGTTISEALHARFNLGSPAKPPTTLNKFFVVAANDDGSLSLKPFDLLRYSKSQVDAFIDFLDRDGIKAEKVDTKLGYHGITIPKEGVHQLLATHLGLPDDFIDAYYDNRFTGTKPPKVSWVTRDDVDGKTETAAAYHTTHIQYTGDPSKVNPTKLHKANELLYKLIHDSFLDSDNASIADALISRTSMHVHDDGTIQVHCHGSGILYNTLSTLGFNMDGNEHAGHTRDPLTVDGLLQKLKAKKQELETIGVVKSLSHSVSDVKAPVVKIKKSELGAKFGQSPDKTKTYYRYQEHTYVLIPTEGNKYTEKEAKEYMLSARLYRLAGQCSPHMMLVDHGGENFSVAVEELAIAKTQDMTDAQMEEVAISSATPIDAILGIKSKRTQSGLMVDKHSPDSNRFVHFDFTEAFSVPKSIIDADDHYTDLSLSLTSRKEYPIGNDQFNKGIINTLIIRKRDVERQVLALNLRPEDYTFFIERRDTLAASDDFTHSDKAQIISNISQAHKKLDELEDKLKKEVTGKGFDGDIELVPNWGKDYTLQSVKIRYYIDKSRGIDVVERCKQALVTRLGCRKDDLVYDADYGILQTKNSFTTEKLEKAPSTKLQFKRDNPTYKPEQPIEKAAGGYDGYGKYISPAIFKRFNLGQSADPEKKDGIKLHFEAKAIKLDFSGKNFNHEDIEAFQAYLKEQGILSDTPVVPATPTSGRYDVVIPEAKAKDFLEGCLGFEETFVKAVYKQHFGDRYPGKKEEQEKPEYFKRLSDEGQKFYNFLVDGQTTTGNDVVKKRQKLIDDYKAELSPEKRKFSGKVFQGGLEEHHGFIQWLFPLTKKGQNSSAPVLTQNDYAILKKDPEVKAKMLEHFTLMMEFYGIEFKTSPKISFEKKEPDLWNNLIAKSHNNLRIHRMLTCMHDIGHEDIARGFQDFLMQESKRDKATGDGFDAFSYSMLESNRQFWQTVGRTTESMGGRPKPNQALLDAFVSSGRTADADAIREDMKANGIHIKKPLTRRASFEHKAVMELKIELAANFEKYGLSPKLAENIKIEIKPHSAGFEQAVTFTDIPDGDVRNHMLYMGFIKYGEDKTDAAANPSLKALDKHFCTDGEHITANKSGQIAKGVIYDYDDVKARIEATTKSKKLPLEAHRRLLIDAILELNNALPKSLQSEKSELREILNDDKKTVYSETTASFKFKHAATQNKTIKHILDKLNIINIATFQENNTDAFCAAAAVYTKSLNKQERIRGPLQEELQALHEKRVKAQCIQSEDAKRAELGSFIFTILPHTHGEETAVILCNTDNPERLLKGSAYKEEKTEQYGFDRYSFLEYQDVKTAIEANTQALTAARKAITDYLTAKGLDTDIANKITITYDNKSKEIIIGSETPKKPGEYTLPGIFDDITAQLQDDLQFVIGKPISLDAFQKAVATHISKKPEPPVDLAAKKVEVDAELKTILGDDVALPEYTLSYVPKVIGSADKVFKITITKQYDAYDLGANYEFELERFYTDLATAVAEKKEGTLALAEATKEFNALLDTLPEVKKSKTRPTYQIKANPAGGFMVSFDEKFLSFSAGTDRPLDQAKGFFAQHKQHYDDVNAAANGLKTQSGIQVPDYVITYGVTGNVQVQLAEKYCGYGAGDKENKAAFVKSLSAAAKDISSLKTDFKNEKFVADAFVESTVTFDWDVEAQKVTVKSADAARIKELRNAGIAVGKAYSYLATDQFVERAKGVKVGLKALKTELRKLLVSYGLTATDIDQITYDIDLMAKPKATVTFKDIPAALEDILKCGTKTFADAIAYVSTKTTERDKDKLAIDSDKKALEKDLKAYAQAAAKNDDISGVKFSLSVAADGKTSVKFTKTDAPFDVLPLNCSASTEVICKFLKDQTTALATSTKKTEADIKSAIEKSVNKLLDHLGQSTDAAAVKTDMIDTIDHNATTGKIKFTQIHNHVASIFNTLGIKAKTDIHPDAACLQIDNYIAQDKAKTKAKEDANNILVAKYSEYLDVLKLDKTSAKTDLASVITLDIVGDKNTPQITFRNLTNGTVVAAHMTQCGFTDGRTYTLDAYISAIDLAISQENHKTTALRAAEGTLTRLYEAFNKEASLTDNKNTILKFVDITHDVAKGVEYTFKNLGTDQVGKVLSFVGLEAGKAYSQYSVIKAFGHKTNELSDRPKESEVIRQVKDALNELFEAYGHGHKKYGDLVTVKYDRFNDTVSFTKFGDKLPKLFNDRFSLDLHTPKPFADVVSSIEQETTRAKRLKLDETLRDTLIEYLQETGKSETECRTLTYHLKCSYSYSAGDKLIVSFENLNYELRNTLQNTLGLNSTELYSNAIETIKAKTELIKLDKGKPKPPPAPTYADVPDEVSRSPLYGDLMQASNGGIIPPITQVAYDPSRNTVVITLSERDPLLEYLGVSLTAQGDYQVQPHQIDTIYRAHDLITQLVHDFPQVERPQELLETFAALAELGKADALTAPFGHHGHCKLDYIEDVSVLATMRDMAAHMGYPHIASRLNDNIILQEFVDNAATMGQDALLNDIGRLIYSGNPFYANALITKRDVKGLTILDMVEDGHDLHAISRAAAETGNYDVQHAVDERLRGKPVSSCVDHAYVSQHSKGLGFGHVPPVAGLHAI